MQSALTYRFRSLWLGAALTAALSVSACGDPAHDLKVGTIGYVNGFAGLAVSSEPRSVLVARDVLSAGGTAADAAVAMAFTLSVTLPTSAGLGAGGVCLVHDHTSKKTQTLDFLPPPAQASMRGAAQQEGTPLAIPTMPRAMYALYAQSGRLRWEQLLAPAENIARFGEPVSRALSREIAQAAGRIANDPLARSVFAAEGGRRPVQEGDALSQLDLSAVISRIRQQGPGDLYSGKLANQYVTAARQLGGQITLESLRSYSPEWRDTVTFPAGNETIHFTSDGITSSEAGRLWKLGNLSMDVGDGKVPGVGAVGFTVADSEGSAVACALTMNGPFGLGHIIPATGMFAVAPSAGPGQSRMPISVALVMNENVNEFRFAAAAAGGGAFNHVARSVQAFVEEKTPVDLAKAISETPNGPALLNVASCNEGLPSHPGSCRAAADPRGAGYALLVGVPGS